MNALRGKIIMSCGCEETDERPGYYATYKSFDTFDDGSYGPCEVLSHMCWGCIDRFKADGVEFIDIKSDADIEKATTDDLPPL